MRISDWSSDVCSSDLSNIPVTRRFFAGGGGSVRGYSYREISPYNDADEALGGRSSALASFEIRKIGRASGRERVGQYVEISVVAESLNKKEISQIDREQYTNITASSITILKRN